MHSLLRRGPLALAVVVSVGLALALFPATTFAASTGAPLADAAPKIEVSLGAAILIGLGYYISYSPWLGCMFGYFTTYRPLVAGLFVGIILGDPAKGTLVGAAINLAYLGFISAGGTMPGDPGLAGWLVGGGRADAH